jgi:starch synthase
MVSSEAAPYAKTGGLADVVGALPPALQELGHQVAVVLPRYASVDFAAARRVWDHLRVYLGPDLYDLTIYQAGASYPLYLVDCPPLFDRKALYGEAGKDYPDNHIRFAVLARAALGIARHLFHTDIFHCHDWQAGLVPAYLRSTFAADPTFFGCRTVFTIHNLAFQGIFPKAAMAEVALDPRLFTVDGLEFWGKISYMKAGLEYSDALTTVSPTYASEIQTPEMGAGLDGLLRARANVLTGILNGVDYAEWSPEIDPHIPARYSAADLSGKTICKQALLKEFGLTGAMDRPLLGLVSRFTPQKGIDLIVEAAPAIFAEDAYIVALGTGDREYENALRRLQQEHPGRISVRVGFDNGLAHRIEAGSDIFLMPSRFEPCGLNQMYSLRYGTPPAVRATGGLDDTIDEDTGFKFAESSAEALLSAVRAALEAYSDSRGWQVRMCRGMAKDFSWRASAAAYSELYRRVAGQAAAAALNPFVQAGF